MPPDFNLLSNPFSEIPGLDGQFLSNEERKFFCRCEVAIDLGVVQAQQSIDIVAITTHAAMLTLFNDLPFFEDAQVLLHRRLADTGLPGDGGLAGPAIALVSGAVSVSGRSV